MTLEKFIEIFVKIELQKDGSMGHYPFHMVFIKKDGTQEMTSFVGVDVFAVYKSLFKHIDRDDAKEIFLSIDFGPVAEVKTDFVAVYHWTEDMLFTELTILPYNIAGEMLQRITEGITVETMITELQKAFAYLIHKDA
jgi:hypothetical protein